MLLYYNYIHHQVFKLQYLSVFCQSLTKIDQNQYSMRMMGVHKNKFTNNLNSLSSNPSPLCCAFSSPVGVPHNSTCNLYGEICWQHTGAFLSLHLVWSGSVVPLLQSGKWSTNEGVCRSVHSCLGVCCATVKVYIISFVSPTLNASDSGYCYASYWNNYSFRLLLC